MPVKGLVMKHKFVVSLLVRNHGAIGKPWKRKFTVEATGVTEAIRAASDKATAAGLEFMGASYVGRMR